MSHEYQSVGLRRALDYCIGIFERYHVDYTISDKFTTGSPSHKAKPHHNIDWIKSKLSSIYEESAINVIEDAIRAADKVKEQREHGLTKFWSDFLQSDECDREMESSIQDGQPTSSIGSDRNNIIDIVRIRHDKDDQEMQRSSESDQTAPSSSTISSHDSSADLLTAFEIKRKYIHANAPCLIRGLGDDTMSFASLLKHWTKTSSCDSRVNDDWFQSNIGHDVNVPVKRQPQSDTQPGIHESVIDDDDYKTMECETLHMKLKCWIDLLAAASIDKDAYQIGYLKDWHLQGSLQKKWKVVMDDEDSLSTTSDNRPLLYKVPPIFTKDVLNLFLLRFMSPSSDDNMSNEKVAKETVELESTSTDQGHVDPTCLVDSNDTNDFRFVYWGPDRSFTALHSDVLNTFSWSFNVVGKKLWTFYVPQGSKVSHTKVSSEEKVSFQVVQSAGETIFVPSGWKHEVVNIGETLSVNHNWITASTLDRVWDCILAEIQCINSEMMSWMDADVMTMNSFSNGSTGQHSSQSPSWDYKMLENMLRGCISGLNVSSFAMMLATEMVEIMDLLGLFNILETEGRVKVNGGNTMNDNDTRTEYMNELGVEEIWEAWFDLMCVANVLALLLKADSATGDKGQGVGPEGSSIDIALECRLGATMENEDCGCKAMNVLLYLSSVFYP